MTKRSIEERVEDYDRMIERLREKKREMLARHSQEERKAGNHARMVLGGMVLDAFPEGWRSVDFDSLERTLAGNVVILRRSEIKPLSLGEAKARLREWEYERRRRNEASAHEDVCHDDTSTEGVS